MITLKADDMAYTTGGNPNVVHRRHIDAGGYGLVHELYEVPTGKTFARKLIYIPSRASRERVENEAQSIIKLCGRGANTNIVTVLRIGELSSSPFYFIDMELCDLNLQQYMHSSALPDSQEHSIPYYIRDAPPPLRAQQIWNIMTQVASGTKYIHGLNMVHRDLKPANILYSREDSAWKLADFGITSEGTSQTLRTTNDARGSPSYRAPELLVEDSVFNNKVDIWSMGCILYELAVGQKPFRDDFATIEHKRSEGVLEVLLDESFGERCKESVTRNILWMLRIEASERPSARELFDEFQQSFRDTRDQCHYGLQIHRDFHKAYKSTFNHTDSLNSWVEDLDLASDQTHSTELEPPSDQLIGCGINNDSSEDEGNQSIQRCLEAVDKDPMNYWLWNSLCNLYIANGDLDSAIEACKHGINLYGTNPSPSMALSNLYAAKGDFKSAIEIGTRLHRFESDIVLLALTQFRDPFTTIKQQSERYLTFKEIIDRSLGRLDLGRNGAIIKTWLSATWFSTDGPEMNMYLAAWTGNVESLKANIRRGGNVMSPDNFGWTTLHLAVWNLHTDAIMFLLDAPVTASKWVSAKNRWSVSALTLAARNNDVPTITALENAGAEIWTSDEDGLTPLHWAASEGHLAAITALSKRSDVSARDKNGRTAIHLAASRGDVEVINQLDGDILARDNDGHTPMNLAIQREQVDAIKALEKLGVDVSAVDEGGRTLLHIAAEFGGVNSIQALKELGADISARDQEEWTAMHFAACGGYAKTIDALKRAGAKVSVLSKTKRTPMHFAAERGHLEAIKALKDAGANFSMQDKNGMTPMHLAAVNGHTEVVKTLQQYGASVSAPQNQGQTPMHFAAGSGHVGVIKILKALGADVSAQDKGGSRPLDLASRNGHLLASQLLKTPSSSRSSQEPKAVNTQAFRRGNRKRR